MDIRDIILKIKSLKGENVQMEVQKGRNKIEKYKGVIESVYPSIFTVKLIDDMGLKNSLSYSYTEVLCGDVVVEKSI
jgi:uncharacterized protein Veg